MTPLTGMTGAIVANLLWGLSPLYYKQLNGISPLVLLCAQVVLTFVVLYALQGFKLTDAGSGAILKAAPTALLIGLNWAAYVGAVMNGQALQASYAYFIAPILTVFLGSLAFQEPMPRRQWLGVAVTIAAVTLDVVLSGEIPYLGILIAIPFAVYVVLHKRIGSQNPISSLMKETFILAPFALIGLWAFGPEFPTAASDSRSLQFLALIGFVNALPLLLFIRSAPALSAHHLGTSQFVAPITSAALSCAAFGVQLGPAKILVLALLTAGMACAVLPVRAPANGPGF